MKPRLTKEEVDEMLDKGQLMILITTGEHQISVNIVSREFNGLMAEMFKIGIDSVLELIGTPLEGLPGEK